MKQQCNIWAVWATWIGLPLLAIGAGLVAGWPAALLVLLAGAVGQFVYIALFPRISRWVGYGSVADEPAGGVPRSETPRRVTLYTASICPFCPLVRSRLKQLQARIGFELVEVDVTFRPELIRQKGLSAVPAVEAGGRVRVGNATSAQLADFLSQRAGSA